MPRMLQYTDEFKDQAVRFVFDSIEATESRKQACERLAPKVSSGSCSGGCTVGYNSGGHLYVTRIDICDLMTVDITLLHEFGHAAGLGHGILGYGNRMGSGPSAVVGPDDARGLCQINGHAHSSNWGSCACPK